MSIRFICPSCRTEYTVHDRQAGQKSECKKCGQRIEVPPAAIRNKTVLGESIPASTPAIGDRPLSAPTKVSVACPKCGFRGQAAAHFSGAVAKCPRCSATFTVGDDPLPGSPDPLGSAQPSEYALRPRRAEDNDEGYDRSGRRKRAAEGDYRDDWQGPRPAGRRPGQGLAIASVIVGACGIFISILSGGPVLCAMCCIAFAPFSWAFSGLGGLVGVIGLVLAFASRSAGNRSGFSIVGIVTSAAAVLCAIIGIVLTIAFPVAIMATNPDTDKPGDRQPDFGRPAERQPDNRGPVGGQRDTGRPSTDKSPVQKAPAVIDAGNGNGITNDFIANPISAERKWIGKRVRIRTSAVHIDRDSKGFYITLMCNTHVYPAKSELDKFSKVREMDTIEIEVTLVRYTTANLANGHIPQVSGEEARLIANHGQAGRK